MRARTRGTMLILDHLGLEQPFHPPAPPEPFADLPGLLALADCDNVAVKTHRRLHAVSRTLSLRRYLGAALPGIRRIRPRTVPVGHRLDTRGPLADLRAGRGAVPPHGAPDGRGARNAHGRAPCSGYTTGGRGSGRRRPLHNIVPRRGRSRTAHVFLRINIRVGVAYMRPIWFTECGSHVCRTYMSDLHNIAQPVTVGAPLFVIPAKAGIQSR